MITQTQPAAFEEVVRFVALDGMDRATAARVMTPGAIIDNAHRIYDWMHEVGLPAESDTREVLFVFAAEAFGVDYEVFFQAWLNEIPVASR